MTRRPPIRPPAALATVLLSAVLLTACGGEESPPVGATDDPAGDTVDQSPAPTGADRDAAADEEARTLGPGEILTPDDAGALLRLAPGEEASLHLAPPWQDAVAQVADPALVELVPVEHFADPGYAEHTVVAHAAGRTVVSVRQPDGQSLELSVLVEE